MFYQDVFLNAIREPFNKTSNLFLLKSHVTLFLTVSSLISLFTFLILYLFVFNF